MFIHEFSFLTIKAKLVYCFNERYFNLTYCKKSVQSSCNVTIGFKSGEVWIVQKFII